MAMQYTRILIAQIVQLGKQFQAIIQSLLAEELGTVTFIMRDATLALQNTDGLLAGFACDRQVSNCATMVI